MRLETGNGPSGTFSEGWHFAMMIFYWRFLFGIFFLDLTSLLFKFIFISFNCKNKNITPRYRIRCQSLPLLFTCLIISSE